MNNKLLPIDFANWDWNESDDTKNAYNALINKGFTTEFKSHVWNDLVLKLDEVFTTLEFEWKSKFANLNNTKVSGEYPVLTSKIFNSLAYNVANYMNATYKWEFDKSYYGYVGKSYFVGSSESEKPDVLYGDYIIELVRKLNLLIDVYKGIGPTFDLEVNEVYKSISSASVLLKIVPSRFETMLINFSCFETSLLSVLPQVVRAYQSSKFSFDITLDQIKEDGIKASIINHTFFSASLELEDLYKNLSIHIFNILSISSSLYVNGLIRYLSSSISNSFKDTLTLSIANLFALFGNAKSFSTGLGGLTQIPTKRFNHEENIKSVIRGKITQNRSIDFSSRIGHCFSSISELYLSTKSYLAGLLSTRMYIEKSRVSRATATRASSNIKMKADITSRNLTACSSCGSDMFAHSEFVVEGSVLYFRGFDLNGEATQVEVSSGDLTFAPTIKFDELTLYNLAESLASIEVMLISSMDVVLNNVLKISARFIYSYPSRIKGELVNDLIVDSSSLENFNASNSMSIDEVFYSLSDVVLEPLKYDYSLASMAVYESVLNIDLSLERPVNLFIQHIESEIFNCLISFKEASETMNILTNALSINYEANVYRRRSFIFNTSQTYKQDSDAELTFDPSSWLNPILEDNVLSVFQVYDIKQDDNTLLFDMEV